MTERKDQRHVTGRALLDQLFDKAIIDVRMELARQIDKWGLQSHNLPTYYTILGEEVGEVANAILGARVTPGKAASECIRSELVQVAAVAIAMIEAIDTGRSTAGEFTPGIHADD